MKKATFIFSSFLLLLIASTMSQKIVGTPGFPEDYHMTPTPKGRYEWRSKNLTVTWLGSGCVVVGALCLMFFLLKGAKKPKRKRKKEKEESYPIW